MSHRGLQSESTDPAFHEATQVYLWGIKSESGDVRRCLDQYVGRISTHVNGWDQVDRVPVNERPKNQRCVLLVLESPHKDEYNQFSPKPANGSSGRNIAKYFLHVKGFSGFAEYGLILINAVQYQCSRGDDTKIERDKCFRHIWNNGGRTDFMERLKAVRINRDVIVNACTKGTQIKPLNEQLRCLVHSAVLEAVGPNDVNVFRRNHPARWYRQQNREYEWEYHA